MCRINGLKLEMIRKAAKMSQKALAQELGVAASTINNYESGKSNPSDEIVDKLCMILKVHKDDIEIQNIGFNFLNAKSKSARKIESLKDVVRVMTPEETENWIESKRVLSETEEKEEVEVAMQYPQTVGNKKYIVDYRETNGRFTNRKQLLKVAKLGPKAFEQCAGFMRITGGDNPLDATSVHPESYEAAKKLLALMGYDSNSITSGELIGLRSKVHNLKELSEKLEIGEMTLEDIIKELEKPGRDPREEMPKPILRKDVLEMKDLQPGMILKGTVRNVIDFGAFVDIGVHQDGLVHISQMRSDRRVEHPLDVVSVGDIVDVRVIEVDANKGRIALSMILDEKEAQNKKISRPAKDRRTKKDRPKKQEGLNLSGLSKFMH